MVPIESIFKRNVGKAAGQHCNDEEIVLELLEVQKTQDGSYKASENPDTISMKKN